MRRFASVIFIVSLLVFLGCSSRDKAERIRVGATHDPAALISSPNDALTLLKYGNLRFVQNKLVPKTTHVADRAVLASGQKPYAVVLCCSDSRVPPEIFFDQKIGDIFVIRNAGNVVDPVVLGSIEYGAEHLGSPIVVVIGHSKCGAVTAACEGGELPENIQSIVDVIAPSVTPGASVDEVVKKHAKAMAKQVEHDHIIEHLGTKVLPAYYDIESGEITWL